MEGIFLSAAEISALHGVGWPGVGIYLELRARMDLRTGMVGDRAAISRQALREATETATPKGAGVQVEQVSLQALRTGIDRLVRAGLLERKGGGDLLVFWLPKGQTNTRVQIKPNRGSNREHGRLGSVVDNSSNTSIGSVVEASEAGYVTGFPTENPTENPTDIGVNPKPSTSQSASTDLNGGGPSYPQSAAAGLADNWRMARSVPVGQPGTLDDPLHNKAVKFCAWLRKQGVEVRAMDPYLRQWVAEGIEDAVMDALPVARDRRADSRQPISAAYLNGIARGRLADAQQKASRVAAAWWTTEAATLAKAAELGMQSWPGEGWPELRARIRQRLAEDEGRRQA